jgi:hypothetical protein
MRTLLALAAIAGLTLSGACSREPEIDEVPVGSSVQLTREDGALVEGRLSAREPDAVRVDVGPTTRAVPRSQIVDFRVKGPNTPAEPPAAARFRELTVPADAMLSVELVSAVGSAFSRVNDPVRGVLTKRVVVGETAVIPAGAEVSGVVTNARPSGKVKGRASLAFHFDRLTVGGETYPLNARFVRTAAPTKGDDAEKIAIPATGGAIIGAIIGGNKGAAVGAAAGGGAGAAIVLSTPGAEVSLDEGTVLSLETGRTFVVRVPLARQTADRAPTD